MAKVVLGGKDMEVDEDGFIQDPNAWDEGVAQDLAKTEHVEIMNDEHWRVVKYIREYYIKFQIAPMVRKLWKETQCDLKHMYELFPSGPAKGACKVAGLPKPTGCV
jgi:dissimilatory sulfite reductase related protein